MVVEEKYSILLNASFTHEFFASGIAEGLTPTLSNASAKLVNDFNLLFKSTTQGFTFLYNTARYTKIPLTQLQGKKITLELDRPEDIFFNYTQVDGYAGNKIFYFANMRTSAPGANATYLSQSAYASASDFYEWYTGSFQMSCTPGTEKNYQLTDLFGTAYPAVTLSPGNIMFNPPPGAYALVQNSTKVKQVYISDRLTRNKPFGIIDIALYDDRMNEAYFIFNNEKVLAPQYNITFPSRSTTWRYFIVNRTQVDIENITIRSNNGVSFVDGGTVKVAAGSGKVFLSENPIVLRQKPTQKFFLSYKNISNHNMEVNIVENVPLPTVDHIFPESSQVYSDVYIYV